MSNYTIEEIEEIQQRPAGAIFLSECQRLVLRQREIIRQLLARVKEAERVEALLKGCCIEPFGNSLQSFESNMKYLYCDRSTGEWDVHSGRRYSAGMFHSFPSLLAALESLTEVK